MLLMGMLLETLRNQIEASYSALARIKIVCGIAHGSFTPKDADQLIGSLLTDQIDHSRSRAEEAISLQAFSSQILHIARTRPSKIALETLTSLAATLNLAEYLIIPLADLKQARRLESPVALQRWKSSSPRFLDVEQVLATVDAGHERITRNDWSQGGAYLVALRAFSGFSLTSLAAELGVSPLILMRRELDEYGGEGPRSLQKIHAAFKRISKRVVANVEMQKVPGQTIPGLQGL